MKRFLSTLLVAMLIVTCLATAAFAAADEKVGVNTVNGIPDEQATVTFTVTGEFASYELYIKYDSKLTLISEIDNSKTAINGSGAFEANEIPTSDKFGKVTFASSKNIAEHTFTVTFVVPGNATCGNKFEVSADLSKGFVADVDGVDQDVTVTAGAIEIHHQKDGGKVTKKATCTEPGEKSFHCLICGAFMGTEEIPAGNHEWVKDEENWKDATCGVDGVAAYKCSICGATKAEPIEATGLHTWDNGVETAKPDCVNPGEMTYTCSVCGATKTESVDPLGHDWETTYKYDDDYHWLECTRCDATDKMGEHSYTGAPRKEGEFYYHDCDVCDYVLKTSAPTGDFEIQIIVGIAAMSAVLAAAAFVSKRKFIG